MKAKKLLACALALCMILCNMPMTGVIAEAVSESKTISFDGTSFTAEAGLWLYNTALDASAAPSYSMIIFDRGFDGVFETNGWGVAIVLDRSGVLTEIYDGANVGYWTEEGKQTAHFTSRDYATVAFSELEEGELLLVFPNNGGTNEGRNWALSLRGRSGPCYIGEKATLTGFVFEEGSAPETPTEPILPTEPIAPTEPVAPTDPVAPTEPIVPPTEPEIPPVDTEEGIVISFDDLAYRTVMTEDQQVWEQNGITVTNDKGEATQPIKDYFNPVRFYARTTVTIAYPGMTALVFTCNTERYANVLVDSVSGATVSADDNIVTITLPAAADTFSVALAAQVRVDAIRVYSDASSEEPEAPEEPVEPELPVYVAEGICGDNLMWKLDEQGVLTISGTGEMWDMAFVEGGVPWEAYRDNIFEVRAEDGVTSIGSAAFEFCYNLRNVSLSDSVESIGMAAFNGCSGLTEFTVSKGVTSISIWAFQGCSNLQRFVVDAENASFSADGRGALLNKDGDCLLFVPEGMTGSYAVPESVTRIVSWALAGNCLESLIIPASVTEICGPELNTGSLWHVLYMGTEAQWNAIAFPEWQDGSGSLESFLDVTRHYNCTGYEIADLGNKVCTICSGEEPPVTECTHDYVCEVVEPTYEAGGYTTYTCRLCGDSYVGDYTDPITYVPGDLNDDGAVDTDDAIYLLYFTLFGDEYYPANQPCDFDNSGEVDTDDAIYLLYHTLFGAESYPLMPDAPEEPEAEYLNVQGAIGTNPGTEEEPVYVTVKGIVGPSLVNQNGFYLIDETGVIAVLTDRDTLATLELGNEVVLSGIRYHKNRYTDGYTNFGQTCIKNAQVVANHGRNHPIPDDAFLGEISIEDMAAFDPTADHTTEVYTVKAYLVEGEWSFHLANADGSAQIALYMSGKSQYAWLTAYAGQEITVQVAACNWNSKGYKLCVLSVIMEDGTQIFNTLNFDNY